MYICVYMVSKPGSLEASTRRRRLLFLVSQLQPVGLFRLKQKKVPELFLLFFLVPFFPFFSRQQRKSQGYKKSKLGILSERKQGEKINRVCIILLGRLALYTTLYLCVLSK